MTDQTTAPPSQTRHAYGWRPSLPDFRNAPADVSGLTAKVEVDQRGAIDAVEPPLDQLRIGSCTSNATETCFRYHFLVVDGEDPGQFSRLWIYAAERYREGGLKQLREDSGAYGHDAFKVARKEGLVAEAVWPYGDGSTFDDVAAYDAARGSRPRRRIDTYAHPAQSEDALKRVLSNDQTVAFGFTVYESFESQAVAETGRVPMPQRQEQVLGGHETLLVGYLEAEPDYFLVRNSWGTDWGLGGYFLMPKDYVLNPNLASDFRTVPHAAT